MHLYCLFTYERPILSYKTHNFINKNLGNYNTGFFYSIQDPSTVEHQILRSTY